LFFQRSVAGKSIGSLPTQLGDRALVRQGQPDAVLGIIGGAFHEPIKRGREPLFVKFSREVFNSALRLAPARNGCNGGPMAMLFRKQSLVEAGEQRSRSGINLDTSRLAEPVLREASAEHPDGADLCFARRLGIVRGVADAEYLTWLNKQLADQWKTMDVKSGQGFWRGSMNRASTRCVIIKRIDAAARGCGRPSRTSAPESVADRGLICCCCSPAGSSGCVAAGG
jgi:hypothetical protein